MNVKDAPGLLMYAVMGWALCGATMWAGMALTSLAAALWIHLSAAPLIFAGLSGVYFRRRRRATPVQAAAAFTLIVIVLDGTVVALLIERSFAMFSSILGTWLPFILIFTSTWAAGRLRVRSTQ